MTQTSKILGIFIIGVLLLTITAPAISQDQQETFVGTVILSGGFVSPSTERLTMDVQKWTTEEVESLWNSPHILNGVRKTK